MGELSLQWSLDRTAGNLIGVSTGLLRAATSDNIQIIALLACEQFGATIAMSTESRHKVFQLCDKTMMSAPLNFLGAQIGYRKGDCGHQLARSDAGLRFLGLASCLSTLDSWDAAVILHKMIYDTAKDKTLVPATQHLKQLMLALQARLAKSGFCESLVGWAALIMNESPTLSTFQGRGWNTEQRGTRTPSSDAIISLVVALSNLGRLGDIDCRISIIASTPVAAWCIAFVKWCLGQPPRIIAHEGSTLSLATLTSDSMVSIRTVEVGENADLSAQISVRIETYNRLGKLTDLFESTDGACPPAHGLMSIKAYGQMKLRQRFGDAKSLEYRACIQALPYACSLIRDSGYDYNMKEEKHATLQKFNQMSATDQTIPGLIFPSDELISKAIIAYQGLDPDVSTSILKDIGERSISDLDLVELAEKRQSQHCPCQLCLNQPRTRGYTECLRSQLYYNISAAVADIMAISLVQSVDPEGVQLFFGPLHHSPFPKKVCEILTGKHEIVLEEERGSDYYDDDNDFDEDIASIVLQHVFELLGHNTESNWIASSFHGQTIYPCLFSTQTVDSIGILALNCISGVIMFGNEQYKNARISRMYHRVEVVEYDSDLEETLVTEGSPIVNNRLLDGSSTPLTPRDDFNLYKPKWEVRQDDAVLDVRLTLPMHPANPGRNPMRALVAAAGSIFVNCPHDNKSTFTPRMHQLFLSSPRRPRERGDRIAVLNSDKNEPVRFFALAAGYSCIVRMDGCLECCIKASLLNNIPRIIL